MLWARLQIRASFSCGASKNQGAFFDMLRKKFNEHILHLLTEERVSFTKRTGDALLRMLQHPSAGPSTSHKIRVEK